MERNVWLSFAFQEPVVPKGKHSSYFLFCMILIQGVLEDATKSVVKIFCGSFSINSSTILGNLYCLCCIHLQITIN